MDRSGEVDGELVTVGRKVSYIKKNSAFADPKPKPPVPDPSVPTLYIGDTASGDVDAYPIYGIDEAYPKRNIGRPALLEWLANKRRPRFKLLAGGTPPKEPENG